MRSRWKLGLAMPWFSPGKMINCDSAVQWRPGQTKTRSLQNAYRAVYQFEKGLMSNLPRVRPA